MSQVNKILANPVGNMIKRLLTFNTTLTVALIYGITAPGNLVLASISEFNLSYSDNFLSHGIYRDLRLDRQKLKSSATEIIIIDSTVEESDTLINQLSNTIPVYYLNPEQDGIEEITRILESHQDLKGIHILGHGAAGRMHLGSGVLNNASLDNQAEKIKTWNQALAFDGDILLYGCNFARGQVGQDAIDKLAQLTNADIAASSDLTGNQSLGGDWILEITKGEIESHSTLEYFVQSNYQMILQVANPDIPSNFCNQQVDLMFVLDESGSVSTTERELQRQSVRNTLQYLVDNNINARAAIVAFATNSRTLTFDNGNPAYIDVNPNTIGTGGALELAIQNYGLLSGLTDWEAGFNQALSVVTATGTYPDALFFFTDGTQNDGNSAINEANAFKTNGTHIYTISIGGSVSLADLDELTDGVNAATYVIDPPNPVPADHVDVDNYTNLSSDFLSVFQDACIQKASLNKNFVAAEIIPTEVSTLTFNITNIPGNPLRDEISFTDELPTPVVIADTVTTNTCNGTLTNSSGGTIDLDDTGITLTNGSLASGVSSCQITIKVTSNRDVNTPTPYVNDSSNISDRNNICLEDCDNPNAPDDFSSTLTVNPFPIDFLAGDLIINEVLYRGTGNSTANNSEFIELFNASNGNINLAGLKLSDGNLLATNNPNADDGNFISGAKFYTFGSGTDESGSLILEPGQYAVVWIGPNSSTNNSSGATFQAWLNRSPKLNNNGEDIWLYSSSDELIDYIAYGEDNAINARPEPDTWDQWDSTRENTLDNSVLPEQSISLTPNGIDGNTSACWEATTSKEADVNCPNFLTIDIDSSDVSSFSSNERITSAGRNNNAASLILVKRITDVSPNPNSIDFNTEIDDGISNSDDDDPNWANSLLKGRINVADVQPGDEVEYTIYFLSNGDADVNNVRICDVVPDNMSFVEDTYGNDSGISLFFDGISTPLSNAISDSDQGKFYVPDTTPPTFCKKIDSSDNLVTVDNTNNTNGAIIVNLGNSLPRATGEGLPSDSYGFIRFRVQVK